MTGTINLSFVVSAH